MMDQSVTSDFTLNQKVLATTFIIIMLWQPTVISTCFQLFMCVNYEDGFSYLRKDTSIKCWSGNHQILAPAIGITFLLIYALIFPCLILWQLRKNRKNLDSGENLKLLGIFYIGLNDNTYYWEILIVNLRKLSLIICATVISSSE